MIKLALAFGLTLLLSPISASAQDQAFLQFVPMIPIPGEGKLACLLNPLCGGWFASAEDPAAMEAGPVPAAASHPLGMGTVWDSGYVAGFGRVTLSILTAEKAALRHDRNACDSEGRFCTKAYYPPRMVGVAVLKSDEAAGNFVLGLGGEKDLLYVNAGEYAQGIVRFVQDTPGGVKTLALRLQRK